MNTLVNFSEADLDLKYMGMEIPIHTCETLQNYLIYGWKPGGFCESMLAKDYDRAITIADTANRQRFWAIATWIRECAPDGSWGSYDTIENWCNDVDGLRTKYVIEVEKKFIWKELKK
jgi:hypothetical protein